MAKNKGDAVSANDLGLTEKKPLDGGSAPSTQVFNKQAAEKASKNGKSFTIR